MLTLLFCWLHTQANENLDIQYSPVISEVQNLNGTWRFRPYQFVNPAQSINEVNYPCTIESQHPWDQQNICGQIWDSYGFGTYAQRILLPSKHTPLAIKFGDLGYAAKVFINGQLVLNFGQLGSSRNTEIPYLKPTLYFIPESFGDTLNLIIQVSNFHDLRGGIRGQITLGPSSILLEQHDYAIAFHFFLFGTFLIMTFYHLVLFLVRPKEKTHLSFGILCLLIGLRILFTEDRFILNILPNLSYNFSTQIEYLTFYLAVPSFMIFMSQLFRDFYHKWDLRLIIYPILLGSAITMLSDVYFFTYLLAPIQILTFIAILITLVRFINIIKEKQQGSIEFFIGVIVFFAFIVNDILFVHDFIQTGHYISLGLLFFLLSQSVALGRRYGFSQENQEILSQKLAQSNRSIQRFVPDQFIRSLGKQNIDEVQLGVHIRENKTLFYCRVLNFNSIASTMSAWENFRFINAYSKRLYPVIHKHQGFVHNYLGDTLMAVFTDQIENAISSALEIHLVLQEYNQQRQGKYAQIETGIAIHYDSMMLGIVGTDEHLQSTILSTNSKIGNYLVSLTNQFQCKILISQETALYVHRFTEKFKSRKLGIFHVNENNPKVNVLEIYNCFTPTEIELFDQTKDYFEGALFAFQNENYLLAKEAFKQVLKINPDDHAAQEYLRQIQLMED